MRVALRYEAPTGDWNIQGLKYGILKNIRPGYSERAQRKPRLAVELSGELLVRAATR